MSIHHYLLWCHVIASYLFALLSLYVQDTAAVLVQIVFVSLAVSLRACMDYLRAVLCKMVGVRSDQVAPSAPVAEAFL